MTQDSVTEKHAAVLVADTHPDAKLICDKLDAALSVEDFERAEYSSSVQQLLQQAWVVAAHKHSTQVTIHHLAYALVFNNREAGATLTEYLETDRASFEVGCILHILSLGVSTGDADVLPPSIGAVRWVGEAVSLARERSERSELLPEDLVQAVRCGCLPVTVRTALRRAVRVGRARSAEDIGQKALPPQADDASSSRDIIQYMEEVEKRRGNPEPADEVTALIARLDEFDGRHAADVADQKQVFASTNKQLELIGQHVRAISEGMTKLETIDNRMSALEKAQPRPPSALRLAAAIIAVLVLGVASGLALTHAQPTARVAEAVSTSSK